MASTTATFSEPEKQPAAQTTAKGADLERCLELIAPAAAEVFGADPRVRAFGITLHPAGKYGFAATRNVEAILPLGGGEPEPVREFQKIPVMYDETFGEV
ncbi:MAG TPA: hypothetical protein VH394_07315, partial [Thermoanaerobaculia bacterium]|nr:hypothetical protein [Thermoanaerobaculia bacterium]